MFWGVWALLWIVAAIPVVSLVKTLPKLTLPRKERRGGEKEEEGEGHGYGARDYGKEEGVFGRAPKARVVLSTVLFLVVMGIMLPDAYMWWVWIFWMAFWTTAEVGLVRVRGAAKAASVLLLILIVLGGGTVAFFSQYNNAVYFDTFIQKAEGFPIQSEVPDNLLRLTTEELARSIASQRMSELGGALEIVDM